MGGITWDLLKKAGTLLIDKFNKRFKGYFKEESDAEKYLMTITQKESYDETNPFRDAVLMLQRLNPDVNLVDFQQEFSIWIQENLESFQKLCSNQSQNTMGLLIETQNVYGGNVKNIGIEYH